MIRRGSTPGCRALGTPLQGAITAACIIVAALLAERAALAETAEPVAPSDAAQIRPVQASSLAARAASGRNNNRAAAPERWGAWQQSSGTPHPRRQQQTQKQRQARYSQHHAPPRHHPLRRAAAEAPVATCPAATPTLLQLVHSARKRTRVCLPGDGPSDGGPSHSNARYSASSFRSAAAASSPLRPSGGAAPVEAGSAAAVPGQGSSPGAWLQQLFRRARQRLEGLLPLPVSEPAPEGRRGSGGSGGSGSGGSTGVVLRSSHDGIAAAVMTSEGDIREVTSAGAHAGTHRSMHWRQPTAELAPKWHGQRCHAASRAGLLCASI